jgi:hypothetical protein
MKPFGYHLTSLLFHAASAAVFYLVARRLLALAVPAASTLAVSAGATAAALFFAIHPLRVESVAWITERRDVTSGLFFLLTLLAYLRAHERPPAVRSGWRWAALAFAALALTSKSIVMGLPLVLVILDVYPLRRLGPRLGDWVAAAAWPIWREKIPFVLLAAATGAVAFLVQRSTGYLTDAEPAARVVMVFQNVCFHAWKTFMPLDLAPIYELPSRLRLLEKPYLLSAAGSVATTVTVWLLRKRWPAGLATWAFYLVMLAPVSGIVHTGNHLGADRNTYLPCAGFAVLVGALVVWAAEARRRGWLRTPVAALVVALVVVWIVGLGFAAQPVRAANETTRLRALPPKVHLKEPVVACLSAATTSGRVRFRVPAARRAVGIRAHGVARVARFLVYAQHSADSGYALECPLRKSAESLNASESPAPPVDAQQSRAGTWRQQGRGSGPCRDWRAVGSLSAASGPRPSNLRPSPGSMRRVGSSPE